MSCGSTRNEPGARYLCAIVVSVERRGEKGTLKGRGEKGTFKILIKAIFYVPFVHVFGHVPLSMKMGIIRTSISLGNADTEKVMISAPLAESRGALPCDPSIGLTEQAGIGYNRGSKESHTTASFLLDRKQAPERRPMAATMDPKSKATVFYSWQSDLPNATNRGLILDALERAAKKIRSDDSVTVEPVLDRDTQNVPGAPDIAHTIFQKIEKADAFVADISIINPGLGRPTPNPNVLLELGYALKTLGNAGTILVANTVNGSVESLPFDLRTKRVLTYRLTQGAEDKPDQRCKLQEGLEAALRAILIDLPTPQTPAAPSAADRVIESIEAKSSSQSALCNRFMVGISERLRELTPKLEREKINEWDDHLVEAIQRSLPLVTDFAKVADAAAIHDSREAALGLFRGFAPLFTQYNLPPETGRSFYVVQFDFPKFIGHELMVALFTPLVAERRWRTVADLCQEPLVIPNATGRFSAELTQTYLYASAHVELLDHRNRRLKLNRMSLRADILKERHDTGQLGELCPWQRFQDADVFLYLRSALAPDEFSLRHVWRPWSAAVRAICPGSLLEAIHQEKAKKLIAPLGLGGVPELRSRLKERVEQVGGFSPLFERHNPLYDGVLEGLRADLIGTK